MRNIFLKSRLITSNSRKGFSLIDVLVGVALMVIVFLGVFGAYRLGLRVIEQSERKITATAIAKHHLERIRDLPYLKVGTKEAQLPYAQGILDSSATTSQNKVEYRAEIKVKLIADSADGLDEEECDWDYKKAQVLVSWQGLLSGEVKLATTIAPQTQVEEVAVCQAQPGGILSVSVFDAYGDMVSSPLIEIFDPQTGDLIDSYSPSDGEHNFPLSASTYKVVVSKSGFNSARTYGTEEVATPENRCYARPHQLVSEGQLVPVSFCIDRTSTFSVDTLSTWSSESWSDSFQDTQKISEIYHLQIADGEARLATTSVGQYYSEGYLNSTSISPGDFSSWDKFSWSDQEPQNTDFKHQIYYASDTQWFLIPDSDLSGNSEGFDSSPVDLSGLATSTYSELRLKANASTSDSSQTPSVQDWQVSWITSQSSPLGEITFSARGEKQIGLDSQEDPVYKYNSTSTSDLEGKVDIEGLEWDSYTFSSADPDLDLATTSPGQPIDLQPNSTSSIDLYFEAQNSLVVTVLNKDSLDPIFGATTTLSNSDLGYQEIKNTNAEGQASFIPLEQASYDLEAEASGYLATSTSVSVSGDETKTLKLNQVE